MGVDSPNCELTRAMLGAKVQLVREFRYAYLAINRPHAANDTYLVMDDFERLGRCWRETDADGADRETMIRDLAGGQYKNPVRIVAFNTAEGWSPDVTMEIADELRRRSYQFGELSNGTLDFIEAKRR